MQEKQWKEIKKFILILFVILLFVMQIELFMTSFSMLMGIISPLLIGIAIAFLLNRVMLFFERILKRFFEKMPQKLTRFISILLSYATFLVVLTLIINIVVPELIVSIERLTQNFGTYWQNFEGIVRDFLHMLGYDQNDSNIFSSILGIDFNNLGQLFSNLFDIVSQQISKIIPNVFSITTNIISNIVTFFISIFVSIYLLLDKEKIFNILQRMTLLYTNKKVYDGITYVGDVIVRTFNKYVVGQLVEACILGMLCFLGMKILALLNIFHFDYALLISVLVGVTALVPILGAYVGGGISFFLLFLISPLQAIIFLVYLIILQQLENNLIYPYVVGGSVGLPPLLVLLSVTIGGALFGFLGMLVAVPVASIIYILIKNDMERREKKQLEEEKANKIKDKPQSQTKKSKSQKRK